jgi:hypothetical protein
MSKNEKLIEKKMNQLLRDLDDSSDEDELDDKAEEEQDFDEFYQEEEKKFVIEGNELNKYVYLIHILANQILYSKAVNTKYHETKLILAKNNNQIDDTLKKILKKTIESIVDKPDEFSFTWNKILLAYEQDKKNLFLKIDTELSRLEFLEQLSAAMGDWISLNCTQYLFDFFDLKANYRDKKPYNEIAEDEVENFKPSKGIIGLAVSSVKERSNGEYCPGKDDSIRDKAFTTKYKNLANCAWDIIKNKSGKAKVWNQLSSASSECKKNYIQDLIILDDDNDSLDSQAWSEATKNPCNYWLIDYLDLSDNRFKEYIKIKLKSALFQEFDLWFNQQRNTLKNYHTLQSEDPIQFLANIRLIHRSLRRETKNLKQTPLSSLIYKGKNDKKFHFQWLLFKKDVTEDAVLEIQKIHPNTEVRKAKVVNGGSYEEYYNELMQLKNYLNVDDKTIARWIKNIFQGSFDFKNIEQLKNTTSEEQSIIVERLGALTYLLFGCEVARNPASLLIHHMMLDLIIGHQKKYTWHGFFCGNKTIKLPMSISEEKDNIAQARTTNVLFSKSKYQFFPYRYDDSNDSSSPLPLLQAEEKVIKLWLKDYMHISDKDISLNDLASIISESSKEWFGTDGGYNYDIDNGIKIKW